MKVGEFARRAVRPGCPRRLSSKPHLKERAAICVCSMRRERRKAERPILSIARPDQTPRQKEA